MRIFRIWRFLNCNTSAMKRALQDNDPVRWYFNSQRFKIMRQKSLLPNSKYLLGPKIQLEFRNNIARGLHYLVKRHCIMIEFFLLIGRHFKMPYLISKNANTIITLISFGFGSKLPTILKHVSNSFGAWLSMSIKFKRSLTAFRLSHLWGMGMTCR